MSDVVWSWEIFAKLWPDQARFGRFFWFTGSACSAKCLESKITVNTDNYESRFNGNKESFVELLGLSQSNPHNILKYEYWAIQHLDDE